MKNGLYGFIQELESLQQYLNVYIYVYKRFTDSLFRFTDVFIFQKF